MKLYPKVASIFIIWLISVLFITYFGFSTLPHSNKFEYDFFGSFGNWDGGHFLGIAKAGYSQKFQYAFFPLYPLAIKILSLVTHNFLLAAVLISMVATFLGLNLLYKLVIEDFDKKIATETVLIFLFFPTSFFLLTAYSEGLFFFLAVLTFYLLRQKKLFWGVAAAALVSATRLAGLAVGAGLIAEVIATQGFNRKNWYIIFAPAGFVIYCIYLYLQTGDPFYFITAENHWQRTLAVPTAGFWQALTNVTSFNIFLDLIFAILGVGFAVRSLRFLPPSLAIYSLLSVGIPLFTATLSSMPRFLLPVFPIFILMALIKKPLISISLRVFSIMLLAEFSTLFITGYFVS
ncbi:MAG: mannosyltransferase family protein [Candidatus Daviesbacteria bacterium]|nr:mannosyltransferase family protein [Candidatus Daviesbacteria bacterium]